MEQDLQAIVQDLKRLEAEVVAAYREQQETAGAVRFADEQLDDFAARLERLRGTLYATGTGGVLRLVTEEHDAVRIRMIYLQHLLEREVPRVYLDSALFEPTAEGRPGAQASTHPATRVEPAPRREGGLLKALLGGGPSPAEKTPPPRAPSPTRSAPRATSVPAALSPPPDMRLIYLHKLMEEDHLRLLSEAQRPPRVADDVRLPDFIANFTAKDFAETHFAVRGARSKTDIARTPEELRAKLAKRENNRGQE